MSILGGFMNMLQAAGKGIGNATGALAPPPTAAPPTNPAAGASAPAAPGSFGGGVMDMLKGARAFSDKLPFDIKVGIGYGNSGAQMSAGSNSNNAMLRKLLEQQFAQGKGGGAGISTNPQPSSPVYKYEPLTLSPMQGMSLPSGSYNQDTGRLSRSAY